MRRRSWESFKLAETGIPETFQILSQSAWAGTLEQGTKPPNAPHRACMTQSGAPTQQKLKAPINNCDCVTLTCRFGPPPPAKMKRFPSAGV